MAPSSCLRGYNGLIEEWQAWQEKARENLDSARGDLSAGRWNACARSAYYACYQAAIAALMKEGILDTYGKWSHSFVQASFAEQLVQRRKVYPSSLRTVLSENSNLRLRADYSPDTVSQRAARGAVRRAEQFLREIQGRLVQGRE